MADVINLFRDLHRIPEVALKEYKTSQYIQNTLSEMGYQPKTLAGTGVYADMITREDLPWMLLRADMDALRVSENSCTACPSEHPGVMHACGHDAHCAMLLAAADQLRTQKLPHNIRFVFQPAEEMTLGAQAMIAQGVLPQNLRCCFAAHVWPKIPKGEIATVKGAHMASCKVYRIKVSGKTAHCASRQLGIDALAATAQIARALPGIQEGCEDPRSLLFCGSMHSGTSHNIVADHGELWGTVRTYLERDEAYLVSGLKQAAQQIPAQFGASAVIDWESDCPTVRNDAGLIDQLKTIFPALHTDAVPTLAGEDFARYQHHAPGVMLWLGTGDTPPLHNEGFYVPEEILPIGVKMWCKIAMHRWQID